VSVSGFPVSLFDCLAFSVTPVFTRTNRVLEVARIFTKHSKCCDKFFLLTMSLYACISLLHKQLLQYTMLKTFTVPPALWTKFAKKFQTKLLAPAFDFTKLSTKTLLLWRCHVSFEYQWLLQNTPASSLLFLSMLKLHCKRHYRNLATYSWLYNMTWTRHENGAGATPTCCRRRLRADQLTICGGDVSKMSAAAAAHSSNWGARAPTFTNGWAWGAPWVEEQQRRNRPNCTDHHESAHQNN